MFQERSEQHPSRVPANSVVSFLDFKLFLFNCSITVRNGKARNAFWERSAVYAKLCYISEKWCEAPEVDVHPGTWRAGDARGGRPTQASCDW